MKAPEELAEIFNGKIDKIQLINKGYGADCYLILSNNKEFLAKKFDKPEKREEENEAILKLSNVKVDGIATPEIEKSQGKWLVTRYQKGKRFYPFIFSNKNREIVIDIFKKIGEYLALFHSKYYKKNNENGEPISVVHGDLNQKNIIFLKNKTVFIFDPWGKEDSVYCDLAVFILNLFPLNFFYEIKIKKNRNEWLSAFLEGYLEKKQFNIDEKLLSFKIKDKLIRIRDHYFSKAISYRIKKYFINIYINNLVKKINNGKIQIKVHGRLPE